MPKFDVVQVRLAHRRAIVLQHPSGHRLVPQAALFACLGEHFPESFHSDGCDCMFSRFLSLAALGSLLAFRRSRLSTSRPSSRGAGLT